MATQSGDQLLQKAELFNQPILPLRFYSGMEWCLDALAELQGSFFNCASPENVPRLPPPPTNLLGLPPPSAPKFSCGWNQIHFARHLVVFRSGGGGTLGL